MFKEESIRGKYKNPVLVWEVILVLTIVFNIFLKYLFIEIELRQIHLILAIVSVYSAIRVTGLVVKKRWIKIACVILSLFLGVGIILAIVFSDSVEKKIIIEDPSSNKSIMLVQNSVWLDSGKNYGIYMKKAFIFKKFIGSEFLKERYVKSEWKENKAILNFDESTITVDLLKEKIDVTM